MQYFFWKLKSSTNSIAHQNNEIIHKLNGTFGLAKNKHQNIATKSNKSQNPLEMALGA